MRLLWEKKLKTNNYLLGKGQHHKFQSTGPTEEKREAQTSPIKKRHESPSEKPRGPLRKLGEMGTQKTTQSGGPRKRGSWRQCGLG